MMSESTKRGKRKWLDMLSLIMIVVSAIGSIYVFAHH